MKYLYMMFGPPPIWWLKCKTRHRFNDWFIQKSRRRREWARVSQTISDQGYTERVAVTTPDLSEWAQDKLRRRGFKVVKARHGVERYMRVLISWKE